MTEDQALRVMMTAHRRGACVVAVYTKDVAEAKATNATDAGRSKGYPLLFMTEPEEQPPHYWSSAPGAEEQGAVLANPNAL